MAAPGNPSEVLRAIEELVAELPARLRGSRERVEEQTVGTLRALARDLGLVTREELDDIELRVAQLEHRLKLLERDADSASPPL